MDERDEGGICSFSSLLGAVLSSCVPPTHWDHRGSLEREREKEGMIERRIGRERIT